MRVWNKLCGLLVPPPFPIAAAAAASATPSAPVDDDDATSAAPKHSDKAILYGGNNNNNNNNGSCSSSRRRNAAGTFLPLPDESFKNDYDYDDDDSTSNSSTSSWSSLDERLFTSVDTMELHADYQVHPKKGTDGMLVVMLEWQSLPLLPSPTSTMKLFPQLQLLPQQQQQQQHDAATTTDMHKDHHADDDDKSHTCTANSTTSDDDDDVSFGDLVQDLAVLDEFASRLECCLHDTTIEPLMINNTHEDDV